MSGPERIVEIMRTEAEAIVAASRRLDHAAARSALDMVLGARGKVIVTGVGKSGVIAEKIAQTMTSTGTMAVFLHPTDALHGSLGVVAAGDVVIALSNSGETDELIALLPSLAGRDVPLIAIVGNMDSTLARSAAAAIDASVDKEACPLNLAPTASTTVALAIGDAIAMTLMEAKGLSAADFAANHPAGRLGKRLTLRVVDLMHASPEVSPTDTWLGVVKAISDSGLGAVNVVDGGKLVGIVTDGDLRRTIERTSPEDLTSLDAGRMMTAGPISTSPDTLAFDALRLMEDRPSQISVLPVVETDGRCVGMLRLHDIIRSGL
ncbi:MAG: KpsF/GutQ family sugar-phosphate isomerase [Acidobacteria bacterium]|nr:KpsF/GutQ family sugar-phosphate isomerase [Acidobacteriota bacterium]MCW5950423.1 KpsF/GutQ family sugar-phosphate isomerase [Pyrinomonadaceae bacterium]